MTTGAEVSFEIPYAKLVVGELRRSRDLGRPPERLDQWVFDRGGRVTLQGKWKADVVLPDADVVFEFKLRWV